MSADQLPESTRNGVAWGLLGHAASSAANFVVIVIAARALAPADFGAFAVAMAWVLTVTIVVRGLTSDVLASAHSADGPDELRAALRAATTTAVVASLPPAALSVALSFVVDGSLAPAMLVSAILMPGLVLQDYLRYALIVRRRSRDMFLNDVFWGVIQIPFLLVAVALGNQAWGLLLAWGLGGAAAAALGMAQARTWFARPSSSVGWLRSQRELWPYFVLDNLLNQANNFGLILVVSLTTTLEQAGALRAVMTIYAPLTILGRGLIGVGVPVLVRRQDPGSIRRHAVRISWAVMGLAGGYVVLALLMPDALGRALLGATWELTEPLVLLTGVALAAGLFSMGIVIGIRSLGAGREGLTARVVTTVLVLGCVAVGSLLDGAYGVAVALALLAPVQMIVWWRLLARGSHRITRPSAYAVPVPPR